MLENISAQIELRQRSNFSAQHIMAAARFARICFRLEEEHKGEPLGSFYDEIISFTTAAILSSVASIEANANEIFADAMDNFISLGSYKESFLVDLWQLIEEKPILYKYHFILNMKGKDQFDKGIYPYQAVDILIKSRNALVHFKPEWQDKQDEHEKIGKHLNGKFQMSPFIVESSPIFPIRCMTHGFAEWAVRSAINFVKWYSELAEIPYRFENFSERLNTR